MEKCVQETKRKLASSKAGSAHHEGAIISRESLNTSRSIKGCWPFGPLKDKDVSLKDKVYLKDRLNLSNCPLILEMNAQLSTPVARNNKYSHQFIPMPFFSHSIMPW